MDRDEIAEILLNDEFKDTFIRSHLELMIALEDFKWTFLRDIKILGRGFGLIK
jgi:hypothetical protein